ncbi:MAG TPA: hypothetical protein VMH85_06450 [Terriglobales bacterium]|nr:hypothetical protein [Terriglobales bacterium]
MPRFSALVVLATIFFALSCGSGRQLQSISITQTANGQQIQFVASGTFTGSPNTVTPLPVMWSVGLLAPPPPQYTLTTQPFTYDCTGSASNVQVVAVAPPDAGAATNGAWSSHMITASVMTCP